MPLSRNAGSRHVFSMTPVVAAAAAALLSAGVARAQVWHPLPPMQAARFAHTSTLLPTGEVLVIGGAQYFSGSGFFFTSELESTELFSPRGDWRAGPRMTVARSGHTATTLPDGSVLVVGGESLPSATLYSPRSGAFEPVRPPSVARRFHTATLLRDGRVLVAGGSTDTRVEIYDAAHDIWSVAPGVAIDRRGHTATLLEDGSVFFVGGKVSGHPLDPFAAQLDTTELFSPTTGQLTAGPLLQVPRSGHTATLLHDGQILVAGGQPLSTTLTGEVVDAGSLPFTSFLLTAEYSGRSLASAALLPNGQVAVVGGDWAPNGDWEHATFQTSLFTPGGGTGTWSSVQKPSGSAPGAGRLPALTTLPSGKLLLTGGVWGDAFGELIVTDARAWLLDPQVGWEQTSWTSAPLPLLRPRSGHTQTMLDSGALLVVSDAEAEIVSDSGGAPESRLAATLNVPRTRHTATLLPRSTAPVSGAKVFIAGGVTGTGAATPSVEIYQGEVLDSWSARGDMLEARAGHSATLMASGLILLAGGTGTGSAEVYDPDDGNGTSRPTGSMRFARSGHRSFLLPGGEILVVGGNSGHETEIYDPDAVDPATGLLGTWRLAGDLGAPRLPSVSPFAAMLLHSNEPLVAGASPDGLLAAQSELYSTGSWVPAGGVGSSSAPWQTRVGASGVTLPNGTAFLSEGVDIGLFTQMPDLFFDRQALAWQEAPTSGGYTLDFELTVTPENWIVRTGGQSDPYFASPLDRLEYRDLGAAPLAAVAPVIAHVNGASSPPYPTLRYDDLPLRIGVSRPAVFYEGSSGGASSSASHVPLLRLVAIESGQVDWLLPSRVSFDQDPIEYTFDELPPSFEPGFYRLTAFASGLHSKPAILDFACSLALETLHPSGQPMGGDVTLVVQRGEPVTLSVEAMGARSYQWQRCDGGLCNAPAWWTDIPGADGPEYVAQTIEGAGEEERFRVIASSPCTSSTSFTFTLVTAAAIFSDGFESGSAGAWSRVLP